MATHVEIPTEPGGPFSERLTILNYDYTLRFAWNVRSNCWVVEFWDTTNLYKILCGVPLVTGCDLLEQFRYLGLGSHAIMTVMSIGPAISPDSVPTFDNLGIDGHLYMTTP
jgi:hypothetical protein